MNLRRQFLPAMLAVLLVPLARASASPASDAAGSGSKAPEADVKIPESTLKVAMPADAVLQIMGKPVSTRPMKVENGKAEVWVYERPVSDRVEQVPFSTPIYTTVTGPDNKPHQVPSGERVEYRQMHHTIVDVIELLMFNDHYVTQKVNRRETQHIDQ